MTNYKWMNFGVSNNGQGNVVYISGVIFTRYDIFQVIPDEVNDLKKSRFWRTQEELGSRVLPTTWCIPWTYSFIVRENKRSSSHGSAHWQMQEGFQRMILLTTTTTGERAHWRAISCNRCISSSCCCCRSTTWTWRYSRGWCIMIIWQAIITTQ